MNLTVKMAHLMGHMQYIVEHDQYRIENPLYEHQMNGKGKTTKADQKRRAGKSGSDKASAM